MTFVGAPLALVGGAALAGAAVLISLYVLKLRRRRVDVAFAQLWQRLLSETESTALWKRLRRILSLLLQLVLLALLSLALVDPRPGDRTSRRTLAIVVDVSASMKSRESTNTTRLDLAKQKAHRAIDSIGDDDLAVIVALDASPSVASPLTSDLKELHLSVDALTALDSPADLARAIMLADDLVAGQPGPEIVLIGDGAYGAARIAQTTARAPLSFASVGTATDNVGITAFAARRYRHDPSSYEVLVDARNYSTTRRSLRLELKVDDEVVAVEPVDLEPNATLHRVYSDLSGTGTHLTARLVPAIGAAELDALPVDDVAYALLPLRHVQRVLFVTRGNFFLEGALLLDPSLEFKKITPEEYRADSTRGFASVVFDGFTPDEVPSIHALYVAPSGPHAPFPIRGTVRAPYITDAAKDHPIARWLALKDLNVAEASVFQLTPGDVAIASVVGKPIWVAREVGGKRTVALGFDVRKSDLPLRVAFPLMVINVLDWFEGGSDEVLDTYATGSIWRIPFDGTADRLELRTPLGDRATLTVREGRALYSGETVGFYSLENAGQKVRQIAASLFSEEESRITPSASLKLASTEVRAAVFPARPTRRRLWLYLVAVVLLLSAIEWWTYHRRVTV